jgi:serine protease Do
MRMTALAARLLAAAVLLLAADVARTEGAGEAVSLQEVILRAKPATVLVVAEVASDVTVNCGAGPRLVTPSPFRETGTGWFVDSNGSVVTNAHVVQPAHEPPRWVINDQAQKAVLVACVGDELARQGIGPGDRPDLEERLKRDALNRALPGAKVDLKPSIFILISNGFRLPAKVAKYSPPVSTQRGAGVMSGRDLALLQAELAEMPSFKLAESKNVKIGDPLRILGFPGVVLTHELLNASAKVEASVTNGAVSGFKQDVQNHPVIQTDAPAAWGNSGGPAINATGEVVGVLTFVSLAPGPEGSLVQGFNFIIPADAVREFLRGTPADLEDKSPFNEKWFAGLRKFFSDDWKGAAASFREADRLQPEFPDVRRMLTEAEEKIKNPPPRPFPWAMATLGVTVVGLGIAGVMYGRRVKANRFRVSPADVVRLFDSGSPPIILDVRAPFTCKTSPFRIPGAVHVSPDDLAARVTSLTVDPTRTVVAYCT